MHSHKSLAIQSLELHISLQIFGLSSLIKLDSDYGLMS